MDSINETIIIPIVHRVNGNLAVIEGIPTSDSLITGIVIQNINNDDLIIDDLELICEHRMIIALNGRVKLEDENNHYFLCESNQAYLLNKNDRVRVTQETSSSLILQVFLKQGSESSQLKTTKCSNPASTGIEDCQKMTVKDGRLDLGKLQMPEMRRLYYLYNIPTGAHRGGHSHRRLHQLLWCVMGHFDLTLSDGINSRRVRMDFREHNAIMIVPGIWRELDNFSEDAVCLVLASEKYMESDYIRNNLDFIKSKEV